MWSCAGSLPWRRNLFTFGYLRDKGFLLMEHWAKHFLCFAFGSDFVWEMASAVTAVARKMTSTALWELSTVRKCSHEVARMLPHKKYRTVLLPYFPFKRRDWILYFSDRKYFFLHISIFLWLSNAFFKITNVFALWEDFWVKNGAKMQRPGPKEVKTCQDWLVHHQQSLHPMK